MTKAHHRSAPPPHAGTLPPTEVRAMFDRIAGVYDFMNDAMTAGLHHRWRARAADLACVQPARKVLDVATGTGDLAFELARRVGPSGEVIGNDFSERMLERARGKARDRGVAIRFELGDATSLPYPTDCFDAATVGFGARNFGDFPSALAEMIRVVKPRGKVVILEMTRPTKPPLSTFYAVWFDRIVPLLGTLASVAARASGRARASRRVTSAAGEGGIAAAYSYLPMSVKRWPAPRALGLQMVTAGLAEVKWMLTAGGIVAIHVGTVR